MNVVDAYSTLGLAPSSSLEDVKKSYRQLAFRYHPDLNPKDHLAKRKFQRLNEAYLLLKQVHAEGDPKAAQSSRSAKADKASKAGQASQGKGKAETTDEAGAWKKAKAAYNEASQQDTTKTNYYFRREDVLQDLLKDAFARQVYEDIYKELHRRPQTAAGASSTTQRKLDIRVGDAKWKVDLSGGVMGGLKKLLMRQLDDEQTVQVSPTNLLPGTKLRVGISPAFSEERKTVEFTLPKDYTLGQPIRLKGLGRRLGPWRGDLYLRLTLG